MKPSHAIRGMILVGVILSSAVLASQTFPDVSDTAQCKGNPAIVAPCYAIHGRLFVFNGTPDIRLWPIATKRYLGVYPPEKEIIPLRLRELLDFGVDIYADFEVCPFTDEEPGRMQMICIEKFSNALVEDWRENADKPKYTRIHGTFSMNSH